MFVFWSRLLVVSLAGTLALALPTRPYVDPDRRNTGDLLWTNRQDFDPKGPVSISPNVLLLFD